MKHYLLTALKFLAVLFILLSSVFLFLFTTTPGFYLTTKLAKIVLPGKLTIEQPQGRLLDNFSFTHLNYEKDNFKLDLENCKIKWQWKSLLQHQLFIEIIHAKKLSFALKKIQVQDKSSRIKLPIAININEASIESVQISQHETMKQFSNIKLQTELTNQLWLINSLHFNFADLDFSLEGQAQPNFPYAIAANLAFKSNIKKPVRGNFKLGGDFSLYYWHGEMINPQGTTINGTLKYGSELHTLATWKQLIWPLNKNRTLESSSGRLQMDGIFPDITINLNSKVLSPVRAEIQLTGQTTKQSLQTQGFIKLPKTDVHLNFAYDEKALPNIRGEIQTKSFALNITGTLSSLTNGEINLDISPGNYQFVEENSAAILKFTGGQFRANLNPRRLQIQGDLRLDEDKSLSLNLDLPQFRLVQGFTDQQAIKGKLNLTVNSLRFLENFSSLVSKIEGQLNALLMIKGTVKNPIIEGNLNLDKAKLFIPQLGLNFDPIQVNLQSRNKHWTTQGFLTSQGKTINLKGEGDFTPEVTGSLTLDGEDVSLIHTDEYVINISPQLTIRFKPNSIDMTGKILVPNAQIKPKVSTNTVSLSEDAVFVGSTSSSPPNPLPLNTDILVEMGENVAIDVKGLQGLLTGSIHLVQLPQGPLNASGELDVRNGKYQAYGQNLTIDQGQLIFTGGSMVNPGISMRAIRRFNHANSSFAGSNQLFDFNSANLQKIDFGSEVTVGIEVNGRLNAPKIQLFSDPSSLSQADILSMLVLGKPANQADRAGGQLLLSAISSMKLGEGTRGAQLLYQLKDTLGVDLNIKSNTKYNQQTNQITESNSVVIGKSVTKRIYLSYNFGLAQADSNVLTLTYLLNKFFSIQMNASLTASGIDLLYTPHKE